MVDPGAASVVAEEDVVNPMVPRRPWWQSIRHFNLTYGGTALRVILWFAGMEPLQLQAADEAGQTATVRHHAHEAFERLDQTLRNSPYLHATKDPSPATTYDPEQFLIGTGQGDLAKGRVTCQRVSELSARSELAKQIRVLVKEHAIDRTRERSGHPTEQDLEVTREEIVQEYLQGVKIVDRHIDESAGLCTSTAIMPRTAIAPGFDTRDASAPAPVSTR